MRFRGLIALVVLLAAAAGSRAASDVVTISGGLQELEALVKKHHFVVAEFYAPWCGHCKNLEPHWDKAATALKDHDPEIVLAKIDATADENDDAKRRFGIGGFPTIKMFKGDIDRPSNYEGPRDEAGIIKYLKKQVLPAATKVDSADAIEAAKKESEALVVAYLEKKKGADFEAFAEVAEALKNDIDFAYVHDAKLVKECGGDCNSPFVIMYKQGETESPRYEGDFTTSALRAWAAKTSIPLVIRPSTQSGQKQLYKLGQAPRLVVAADKEAPELIEQLQKLSKSSEMPVVLATDQRLLDNYGLKLQCTCKNELLIEDPKNQAKYLKSGAGPSDAAAFLKQFEAGKLEKWVKSEEPPADNDGPVRILTARTFDEEVFKSGKDTFIKFHAPWCGHCKNMQPAWEATGAELKKLGDDGVVIAQFDATANDSPADPKLSVRGFPTLYFVTAKGDVYTYDGDRSKKDMLKFIAYRRTTEPGEGKKKRKAAKKKAAESEDDEKDEL
jgi:protein disulfide-isomerase A1